MTIRIMRDLRVVTVHLDATSDPVLLLLAARAGVLVLPGGVGGGYSSAAAGTLPLRPAAKTMRDHREGGRAPEQQGTAVQQ